MISENGPERDDGLHEAGKKDEKNHVWPKKEKGGGPENGPPLFSFNNGQFRFSILFFLISMIIMMVINTYYSQDQQTTEKLVEYSEFKQLVSDGTIKRVHMGEDYYYGDPYSLNEQTIDGEERLIYKTVPIPDPGLIGLLDSKGVSYYAVRQNNRVWLTLLLNWLFPFVLLFLIWRVVFRKMGNLGSGVLSFSQNKARIVAEGDTGITFDDVAGVNEAKEELIEVVDFLKNPKKYIEIGGKIPKGVLLVGAPGTGKTLLAKAVAGEGHVPFFRLSGSDFVEMFVGVGAARVRDLFKQAREKAPCIIFIDELDAIGKSRITGISGNDEREQTLNQLLVEMDGFDSTNGVILLSATNRPEVLDPALLRPGRFDRQVIVDKPDLTGRESILRIHIKNVKIADEVDLHEIAKNTPGFVGADLANVVNEAALYAVRMGRAEVVQNDFIEAIEKALVGLQKKSKLINKIEREIVAYHETGHALTAAFTKGSDPVRKITIVPRGIGALGYTLQTATEDRFLMDENELLRKIDVLLGGRAAEKVIFNKISTGAANDLTVATDIARKMITEYGMSDKFQNMTLSKRGTPILGETAQGIPMQREYSEDTQRYIDNEIARIIAVRFAGVLSLLSEHKDLLVKVGKRLLETETIEGNEFQRIIGEEA